MSQGQMGRPFSVLTPEKVAELLAEYKTAPFNIAARARGLGIKGPALAYHMRGGAAGRILQNHWRAAVMIAHRYYREGDNAQAAHWFREAANRIEKINTTL